mgnify:CR=1 FL=1
MPDPANDIHPLKTNEKLNYMMFGNGVMKMYDFFYENHVSETDVGLVFKEDRFNENKLGVGSYLQDIKVKKQSTILAKLEFFISNKLEITSTYYIKIPNIFAQLGGLLV